MIIPSPCSSLSPPPFLSDSMNTSLFKKAEKCTKKARSSQKSDPYACLLLKQVLRMLPGNR